MKDGELENLEEWSSVMEEKMTRFDDVVLCLKSPVSNVEKRKKPRESMKNILFRKKCSEEGCKKSEDPGDEVTDED